MEIIKDVLMVLGIVAAGFILWFFGFCVYAAWRICTRGDE